MKSILTILISIAYDAKGIDMIPLRLPKYKVVIPKTAPGADWSPPWEKLHVTASTTGSSLCGYGP
jgi:hypothetical protein